MSVIVVANPKGGVGKSTLSTNVAGYLASRGGRVLLADMDRQQSARLWLQLRPAHLPPIEHWDASSDDTVRPPKGADHVVIDTAAALQGKQLDNVLRHADKVLMPVQPSVFDIHATHEFIGRLLAHRRSARLDIAVVQMRSKEGTIAHEQLRAYLGTVEVPVLGALRDTQNYVHLAAHGQTLWDVAPGRVERDLAQWEPLIAWLES